MKKKKLRKLQQKNAASISQKQGGFDASLKLRLNLCFRKWQNLTAA